MVIRLATCSKLTSIFAADPLGPCSRRQVHCDMEKPHTIGLLIRLGPVAHAEAVRIFPVRPSLLLCCIGAISCRCFLLPCGDIVSQSALLSHSSPNQTAITKLRRWCTTLPHCWPASSLFRHHIVSIWEGLPSIPTALDLCSLGSWTLAFSSLVFTAG